MMTVDTRNGWVVIIAAASMGLVIVLSLVGIIALAVAHDGALSADAMDTFKQILLGSGLLGTVLSVVESVTRAQTAKQAIASGASVSGSPITVTTTAAPADGDGTSSPAGISAPDVSGTGV